MGIPNYLIWLLSGSPGKIGGSTVLRTEGVQNATQISQTERGGPGGIRTHDLRLRRPPSWSWLDYRPRAPQPNHLLITRSDERQIPPDIARGIVNS